MTRLKFSLVYIPIFLGIFLISYAVRTSGVLNSDVVATNILISIFSHAAAMGIFVYTARTRMIYANTMYNFKYVMILGGVGTLLFPVSGLAILGIYAYGLYNNRGDE